MHNHTFGRRLHLVALAALLPLMAAAQDTADAGTAAAPVDVQNCAGCHDDVGTVENEKHAKLTCQECHPNVKEAEHAGALDDLPPTELCASCHKETGEALPAGPHKGQDCESCHGYLHDEFKRVDTSGCKGCHGAPVKAMATSIHGEKEVTCSECHGDLHNPARKTDPVSPTSAVMQVSTCMQCHDSKHVKDFRASVHGRGVLLSGLSVAPTCATCHTAHDIKAVKSPESKVSVQNVTQTCGSCHTFILAQWKNSIHGQVFAEIAKDPAFKTANDKQPPVCTSCHPGHETFDPQLPGGALKMAGTCVQCHETQTHSWRDSFHGKASMLGYGLAATCANCHGAHSMLPAANPKSKVHKDNVQKTCAECHPSSSVNFAEFRPHLDPTSKEDAGGIYWLWLFMTSLLVGTFGFFALHTLLWFQRAVVGFSRKEFHFPHTGDQYIRRFRPVHMWIHVAIILTFLTLAATGLPLKFSAYEAAKPIAAMFGGAGVARILHRIAGVLTFGYGLFFLGYLFREVLVRKRRSLLWGWQSMVPNKKDLDDIIGNFKWFLYLAPRPKFDRWAYWEKFDFFAVFWGIVMIGISGLMLWFPEATTQYLPGWSLNIAYIIHSDEALLATGFIFFFHFFHTHLRPESFPLDPVIFTGSIPLERFKNERPAEYERMMKEGTLNNYLVPGPTERLRTLAYLFGFTMLGIGVLLGTFLIYAGVHGLMH